MFKAGGYLGIVQVMEQSFQPCHLCEVLVELFDACSGGFTKYIMVAVWNLSGAKVSLLGSCTFVRLLTSGRRVISS